MPTIGVVAALNIEMESLIERLQSRERTISPRLEVNKGLIDSHRVVIGVGGVGEEKARQTAQALIDAHSLDWVLSCGFSGALIDDLKIGDIVVGTSVTNTVGKSLSVPITMESDPASRLHVGGLFTSDSIVREVAAKRDLANRYKAIAVDMESYAVAEICRQQGIRFMAVRAISDDLSADLPQGMEAILSRSGARQWGAAVGEIWKRPALAGDLWSLRENAMKAARSLSSFTANIISQLPN
ncbi:5'-methylthioadenosine/S-adenosylhomocysteine nucleosidase [Calycomorphotria hydatis]|uniref:5'-methylthioadenosine/S-adenosylhomocysteine nucleosidase n=2 Tax=Calycomorphotria hydatis TaxID=2528027 RepID=A0A517T6B7_9PLAN|nr:5'-methylthioadenosine/S-adenosylhomocysteine nucleosidase [Calycomorphotria hydatis]